MIKNGANDDIGWVVGGLFKMIGNSILGVIFIILHPVKTIIDISILGIIFFMFYMRLKNNHIVNWIDVLILFSFFKVLSKVGERKNIAG
jgi:hypothetical protein